MRINPGAEAGVFARGSRSNGSQNSACVVRRVTLVNRRQISAGWGNRRRGRAVRVNPFIPGLHCDLAAVTTDPAEQQRERALCRE